MGELRERQAMQACKRLGKEAQRKERATGHMQAEQGAQTTTPSTAPMGTAEAVSKVRAALKGWQCRKATRLAWHTAAKQIQGYYTCVK